MSTQQRQVAIRMALALLVTALTALLMAWTGWSVDDDARLRLVAASALIPAFGVALLVGRLAARRFFVATDIDPAASAGSADARRQQAILQNTLEQALLAVIAYTSGALLLPASLTGWVPAAALLFGIGRILFVTGYAAGPVRRAFGFALTFYPTVALLVASVIALF